MFYTYAHTRNDTGKIFYIGKGSNYRATAKNRNKHWKNIVNKFGYKVKILAYWDSEKDALDHEFLLISCFKNMGYELANKANGGDVNSGWNHSEEYKKKMSELRKKLSDDVRIKLSESAKGEKNSFFGKNILKKQKRKCLLQLKIENQIG